MDNRMGKSLANKPSTIELKIDTMNLLIYQFNIEHFHVAKIVILTKKKNKIKFIEVFLLFC